MKIADLYLRVGTAVVTDRSKSLQGQEEILRQYCKHNNIKVRKVIFEVCSAGTFNRPEWNKLMSDWRKNKGQVDMLLFTTWDRFSRNASDTVQMITTLRLLGIEPNAVQQPRHSIQEIMDYNDPLQDSIREILEDNWPRYLLN
jgi:DNA invertase Pin-like site-specific DNA recombinase